MTKDGHPATFDPKTGTFIDALTKEPVAADNIVRDVQYDILSGSGPTRGETLPSAKDFKISKEQNKQFNKELKTYRKTEDSYRKAVESMKKVYDMLKEPDKMTPNVVRVQMPRMFGEVGNMSETEQKIWSGSPELSNAIRRWFNTYTDPNQTFTEKDVDLLKGVLQKVYPTIVAARDINKTNSLINLEEQGIPREYADKRLGEVLKFEPSLFAPKEKKKAEQS